MAQFTKEQRQREVAARAATAIGSRAQTKTAELPHRGQVPSHDEQPLPPAPDAEPPALAITAEADEGTAPAPPPLFSSGRPDSRSPGGEEPPF